MHVLGLIQMANHFEKCLGQGPAVIYSSVYILGQEGACMHVVCVVKLYCEMSCMEPSMVSSLTYRLLWCMEAVAN